MDSSELTYMKKYNGNCCNSTGSSIVNENGPTGPPGPSGVVKSYTLYLDYSTPNSISRIYIPPGLFNSESGLSEGGVYDSDQDSNLIFSGLQNISLRSLTYNMTAYINVLGYLANNQWQQIPGVNISATKINLVVTEENTVQINNLTLGNINGGQLNVKSTFPYADFLASVSITFV
jgi:hypothetical protein